MANFSDTTIKTNLNRLLVIKPLDQNNITGVGYDLNIGYFIKISKKEIIEQGRKGSKESLELEQGESLLIICHEYIYLSNRVMATIHCRGTYAARGLVLNCTTVDPKWDGRMVFLITNIANHTVELDLSKHFGTIVFSKTAHPSSLRPNETKTVLSDYTRLYKDLDFSDALAFIMESDPVKSEYEDNKDKVKRSTDNNLYYMVKKIYWFSSDFVKSTPWYIIIILTLSIVLFVFPGLLTNMISSLTEGRIKFITAIIALIVTLLNIYKNSQKKNQT